MDLKRLTQFSKDLLDIGKEILSRSFSKTETSTPLEEEEKPSSIESEKLIKKFEIPTPDNPIESSRQQSMLDSQGLPNQPESYGLGTKPRQKMNHNMGQRNYNNHQQN